MKGYRIGYTRVSSLVQHPEQQLENIQLDRIFSETTSSKDIQRPQLDELLRFVRLGDTLIVQSMDRLARNLRDLYQLVQTLTQRGVRIEFVKEGFAFTNEETLISTLPLSLLGAFAEFERALIRERQREGIVLARQRGAYRKRKKRLSPKQVNQVKQRIAAGETKAAVARELGISRETLYQYLRDKTQTRKPQKSTKGR
jgi:DNA invertase Pin-like site-specific DNA recombinase